jgi:hypothetical protein
MIVSGRLAGRHQGCALESVFIGIRSQHRRVTFRSSALRNVELYLRQYSRKAENEATAIAVT